MTSVRTCYCKHEEDAARKKDNDITRHNGNRRLATIVSKKSIVTNRIYGDGRESYKRARRIANEGTPNANRLVEAQPSTPVLSPETSTALENAEKIINNAKIQLMEVCATSSFDSARQNRNTYSDEPPLDDETEERLYVRELVASKFRDACSSRLSEANGKASARSEKPDLPRATIRRIDLSAPKFRVSRRRRADWSSLGYGSDDRSRGRASPVRVSSRDSIANETTARDDRARERRRSSLSARGNTCEIQIGPSVHIDDRELTRQNLEDVHISPESSRTQSRANAATYILRHDAIQRESDPEGAPRTRRVRLDATQREKPIGKPIVAVATEVVPTSPPSKSRRDIEKIGNPDSRQNDGRIESPKIRIYRQERKDRKSNLQEDAGTSECLRNATSQGAAEFAASETPRTDRNEKSRNKERNGNHEGIACGGDSEIRYAEGDGIEAFCKKCDADRLRNDENITDKIQAEENQGDRSKPSLDASRKTGFPRREDIASRRRETESPMPYRTIDGHFSHAFNSHNGQDGLRDVVSEDVRRSFASNCTDVFRTEDNLDEIELYRPRLDDLDSILQSNDRKIERVVRVTRNLSELLSDPKFAVYKLDEDERVPQDANHAKLCRDSSADNEDRKYSFTSARSSVTEIELRNEDLTVSKIHRTDEDARETNATETKSTAFARENGSRSDRSKNSVESSVFPASDASDDPRTFRDSDKARQSARACLSESSIDRSDVTTFSNLVPALSSTHTETCRLREEEVARSDRPAKSRVVPANKFSERESRRSGKKYTDDGIFARLSKNTFQTTDRLVAYLLQDEKRSIEGKIASALKESAITPAAVQKLLDHLREAESIRDARQTETLDILRNILTNFRSRSDQGNTNDRETLSRNIPDSSARTKAPSREKETCCESTQCSENNSKRDPGLTESADVARTVPIDVRNETDKGINGKKEALPKNAGSLIRTNATSDATEETILRTPARNNTSGAGLNVDKSEDFRNPDKYLPVSATLLETRESVRLTTHFEFARDSKNNGKRNSEGNSDAESLKQISDIRSDENLGENSERSSAKIASARSREKPEAEVVDSITAIAMSENGDGEMNSEKREDKSKDAQTDKDQRENKIITQIDRVTDAQSDVPEETVREIKNEERRDIVTPADKKVLFAFSEASEVKNERVRSDASSVRSKSIDDAPTKTDVSLSARENGGFSRETEVEPQHAAVKEKIEPADNCPADPPRDCIASSAKDSESSLREVASRNKRISLDTAGEDNSLRDKRNDEIRKSTTFAAARRDGDEISGLRKSARSDNERQLIDLTDRSRNYKIDVLSSSNSSVSSALLDHDDRSTNGMSSANAKKVGTTSETSHSEGELYMPSSCSYSLGEVRVLRKRRDLIEDNAMNRDSSVTILVTRSMLTSLNDSTMSLLESSERV